jgi:Acetyltransferase (isoleucine patch superfamily)
MLNIIIVGAGGCGREVYEMACAAFSSAEYQIKGFLSDDVHILDDMNVAVPIIDTIRDYQPAENDRFLLAIGDVQGRKKVALDLQERGAKFLTLVHPTAVISASAELGEGVIVYPFVFISCQVKLADFVMMNAYSGCGHDAVVGAFSVLCPYATVLGWARLDEDVFLSTHTMVAPKKHVGKGAVVSANSSVLRNVPVDGFVCGVPGKNL